MNTTGQADPDGDADRLRVQIRCDRELVRRGLEKMLSTVEFVRLVQTPAPAAAAPADIAILTSDQVAKERTTVVAPSLRTLMLITDESTEAMAAAAGTRADGYVLESELTRDSLAEALRGVANGQVPVPVRMRTYLLVRARSSTGNGRTPAPNLTGREIDVLRLLADGLTNRQIARQLSISENGVKRHVSNVLNKLNCPNRAQAVARALREGLLDSNQPR
jgi:DNA-binding NarL/FixJ family response regulator